MNTIKSIIRLAVLFALCALGIALIFDPCSLDDPLEVFCIKTIVEEALGIGCIVGTGLLYVRWSKTDRWLSKYEEWMKEAEEAEL